MMLMICKKKYPNYNNKSSYNNKKYNHKPNSIMYVSTIMTKAYNKRINKSQSIRTLLLNLGWIWETFLMNLKKFQESCQ